MLRYECRSLPGSPHISTRVADYQTIKKKYEDIGYVNNILSISMLREDTGLASPCMDMKEWCIDNCSILDHSILRIPHILSQAGECRS
jgi:hypothetical protein